LSVLVIVHSSDAYATDRSLELDKRMGVVMPVAWVGFAVLAKVGIVAYSALVADALDIWYVLLVFAKRTVTVDAIVTVAAIQRFSQGLIDGYKAMAGVNMVSTLDTVWAIVPVWAVQALMADTIDELVAAVTNSWVADVSSRVAEEISQSRKSSVGGSSCEGVARMVAVLVADVAVHAQIVIFARKAGNKFLLGKALDTAVASASWFLVASNGLFLISVGSGNFLGTLNLGLGWHALGGAVDNGAVLNKALDHPVACAGTVNANVDTSRAKIVVAAIADAAVEVLVFHGVVAVVAIYHPRGAKEVRLWAEGEVSIVGCICKVVEEA
jgi:hypothetical protein